MSGRSICRPNAKARRTPAGFLRSAPACLAVSAALLAAPASQANDRPFESARTAVAEDDDNTWSIESWVRRIGHLRSASIEPEYTFDPANSVQMEFTRSLDKRGDETGHEAEIEFKHLFNRFDRDGWGWGASAALGAERTAADRRTVKTLTLRMPVTLAPAGEEAGLHLHLNPGFTKSNNSRAVWAPAVGAEYTVMSRAMLFAEWAHQSEERLLQLGVRYWVKREKVGLDMAWQQRRNDGNSSRGVVIGIGLYDL